MKQEITLKTKYLIDIIGFFIVLIVVIVLAAPRYYKQEQKQHEDNIKTLESKIISLEKKNKLETDYLNNVINKNDSIAKIKLRDVIKRDSLDKIHTVKKLMDKYKELTDKELNDKLIQEYEKSINTNR